jgi:hypothetical protein
MSDQNEWDQGTGDEAAPVAVAEHPSSVAASSAPIQSTVPAPVLAKAEPPPVPLRSLSERLQILFQDEPGAEKWPSDYKTLVSLVTEIEAIPNGSKKLKDARLKSIRGKLSAVQQGLPVLHLDAHAHAQSAVARETLPGKRVERIAALDAVIKGSAFAESAIPANDHMKPRDLLLTDANIRHQIGVCLHVLADAELYSLENFYLLFPRAGMDELHRVIRNSTDPAVISRCQSRIAELNAPGAQSGATNIHGQTQAKLELCRKAVSELISLCVSALELHREQAVEIEFQWLAQFGIEWHRTPVSERFDAALAELRVMQTAFDAPMRGQHLSFSLPSILTWLGFRDVTDTP